MTLSKLLGQSVLPSHFFESSVLHWPPGPVYRPQAVSSPQLLKQQVGVFITGGGGVGAGDGATPAIMKSKQLMNVSGGTVHSDFTQAP